MSSALLKLQESGVGLLESAFIAAGIEASPQPVAITESGNLIYKNDSFAQLISAPITNGLMPAEGVWQNTEFSSGGRKLSVITARIGSTDLGQSDVQHLATIGRLVVGVAHDFNNLLTGILLYCDLLQTKSESAGALWKKTEEIRRAAEQGAALIRQLRCD